MTFNIFRGRRGRESASDDPLDIVVLTAPHNPGRGCSTCPHGDFCSNDDPHPPCESLTLRDLLQAQLEDRLDEVVWWLNRDQYITLAREAVKNNPELRPYVILEEDDDD